VGQVMFLKLAPLHALFHLRDIQYKEILTPWSRVLHAKPTGFQLAKKFPAFYGTRRFLTAFTSARHFLKMHLNIILPSTPGSPKWSLFLRSPPPQKETLYTCDLSPVRATCPAHLIPDFITRTISGEQYRSFSSRYAAFSNRMLPRPS
jgi:hypothetical protein